MKLALLEKKSQATEVIYCSHNQKINLVPNKLGAFVEKIITGL